MDPNVQGSVEVVTPEQARLWLDNNNIENNRFLSPTRVDKYAADIKLGHWQISQPIMFSEIGQLIDGQHRMAAVVRAGIPTAFYIIRGVAESATSIIDTGAGRTTADIAKLINKREITQRHISCFKSMWLAPGCNRKIRSMSSIQIIEAIEQIFECIDFACVGSYTHADSSKITNAVINAVVARAHYNGEDEERLTAFLVAFRTGFSGDSGEKDSAAIALRNFYLTYRSSRKMAMSRRGASEELYNYGQVALRHFLNERIVKSLRLPIKDMTNLWPIELIDGVKN